MQVIAIMGVNMKKRKNRRNKRKTMLGLLGFSILLCVSVILFLNLDPAFGGNSNKEQKEFFKDWDNYRNGQFVNEVPARNGMNIGDSFSMIKESFSGSTERNPDGEIPVDSIDWEKIKDEKDSLTWLGHSTFLLSVDNKKILIDPMLGPIASPVSFVGSRRYNYSENMDNVIDKLPPIDAVFISHDHYDHLDYQSIVKLKDKVSHFFVPLGVSSHLIRWGVPKEKITELNWWDEREYQGLDISLTPSRHFSGRGPLNSNSTLWGGWVITGKDAHLYISGDGGYGPHFKEIGDKYGPFDLALIEGAQYDKRWPDVHMLPEQSVQASLDVKAKNMMLMHWGAFTLAFHEWNEPIERAENESERLKVNLIAPKIGDTISLDSDFNVSTSEWWNLK